jgi:hypothetical protein
MGGKGSGRTPGFSHYDAASRPPTLPPEAPNASRKKTSVCGGGNGAKTEESPSLSSQNASPPSHSKPTSRSVKLLEGVADDETVKAHIQSLQERSAERAAYWERELSKNVTERAYDHEWMNVFLATLRNSGNIRAACDKAGVSRQSAYQARDRDSIFRDAWDEAKQDAVDILEAVAWSRAQTQSDTLLIFLLKHNRPETYLVPKQVEHSGPGGGAIPLALIDSVIADHDPALQIIEGESEEVQDA